jgi:hypothetical protein
VSGQLHAPAASSLDSESRYSLERLGGSQNLSGRRGDNILSLLGLELRPRPARSQSLYRLSSVHMLNVSGLGLHNMESYVQARFLFIYEGPTPTAYKQNNIQTLPLTKWLLINLQQRPNTCRATDAASDAVLLTCTTRGKTLLLKLLRLFQIYRPYLLALATSPAINVTRPHQFCMERGLQMLFLRTSFPGKLSTPILF